jgi:glycosyltransferase involved in cell wall biosynthesis
MKYSTTNHQPPTQHNHNLRIAIVFDWIEATGGAERVIKVIHDMFPDAPIYTSTCDEKAKRALFKTADIRTAWFQNLPAKLRKRQLLTLPRQWYFGHLKLKDYDIVISAGSAEAKAVKVMNGTHIHICYTPTLYYWVKPENYLQKGTDGQNALWRFGLKTLMPYVRKWDLKASKNPDVICAISTAVQERIKKYYDRDSVILHPPADIARFTNDGRAERKGFIVFGRQVKHKKIDLAILACNELKLPLTVVGSGPEHEFLQRIAGPNVTFRSNVSDVDMVNYIASAEAFIFPNEEDFGIVSVEAQAAGIPVIAYRGGGSLDTVVEGVTGEFFDAQSVQSLRNVLENFNYKLYNRKTILENAQKFSTENFQKNLQQVISKTTSTK